MRTFTTPHKKKKTDLNACLNTYFNVITAGFYGLGSRGGWFKIPLSW